jgi:Protein of unknown function (DUF3302)
MGDPFLNYFALFLLVFVVVVLFYGIIAIHAAGWVSLFTLHALWPFLWIWAMAFRPERGWGISHQSAADGGGAADKSSELEDLRRRVAELEKSQRTGAQ